jgi:hypothetical protein
MKKKLLVAFGVFLLALGCFYVGWVHYTEAYQVGLSWNRFTGELRLDDHAGIHITAPWVAVSRIDTRPIRVCVTSSGRGFNCKLVQFEPTAYREFVKAEGFRYYWWSNRFSINMGYGEEYRGMKDLLRGYAYSVKKYPFVTVLRDYQEP